MISTSTPKRPSLPIEEIARLPLPGTAIPGEIRFSPDDRLVTYLFSSGGSLVRELYGFDPHSGEQSLLCAPPEGGVTDQNVSLEEALRRERMRQHEMGITQYEWAKQGSRLLLPLRGDIYTSEGPGQTLRKIVASQDKPALDAQLSPDGNWVAYVQEGELYVIPFEGGEARQLTFGARESGKTHGLAEYIAQEEMGRRHGYWWSPDSRWLAFTEVDETHIPIYRIMHQGKDFTGENAQEDHRYPFAGGQNAIVRLGVAPIEGGEPRWMDLGADEDIYLARVDWLPDGRLSAQIENRAQSDLYLIVFDPQSGGHNLLLHEHSEVWINLHDMFKPLKQPYAGQNGCFIWASERSGFRHLYLYNGQGELIHPLTQGEWMVDGIAAVDEAGGQVYFTATLPDPRQSHLYTVSLHGGEPRRITHEAGLHAVVIDHACQRFIDTWHNLNTPPTVKLRSLQDGAAITAIYEQADPHVAELALQPPEMVTLANREGDTLYGMIYRPEAHFGPGPYPALVYVYGGPHAQMVTQSWGQTVNMRAQYLRSLGFLVFVLDNRGSARRGLAFEGAIRHRMGDLEVQDQVDGVHWLVAQGLADPKRVGIYGWSYGGYMAAMCLARAPETFQAAVAGAPVSNYDGYDTHYTERYMGTPQSNPEGYQQGSVMAHVDKINGRLLLVHGLIDENVHFRHTARLLNALIAARKHYELMLFPDERHSPRRPADRIYMEERIRDFFLTSLNVV